MDTISLSNRVRYLLLTRFFTRLFVVSSMFISSEALSENDLVSAGGFPEIPGVTATGLAGPTVMGLFDVMLPLAGWPTSFLYIDPQFAIQNGHNYSGAGGLGYRWLNDQAGILGAYVFTDYNHSPHNNSFWFVSPGIERLGDTIDFSANAYIPVSNQQQFSGVFQGTQIGQNQFVSFQGHNQFDALFNTTESVGFGADAQIGYRLPVLYNPKFFLGGYYANPEDASSILGGAIRVEVPLSENIRISLSEAYDNFAHNTFKVGLAVDLIERHTIKNYKHDDLASRMLDPIQRNLILVSGGSVTNQPISQNAAQFADSALALVRSNISFFQSEGSNPNSTQDGTFENPYQGLTQAHVNDGNNKGNTNFYFNTGTYIQNSTINFTNDNIYGRQTFNGVPFALPASGSTRPIFDFSGMSTATPIAFNMTANTDIEVEDIVMKGNNGSTGILMAADAGSPINITFSDLDDDCFW